MSCDRATALRAMLEAIVKRREDKAREAAKSDDRPDISSLSRDQLVEMLSPVRFLKMQFPPLWQERMKKAETDGVMESLYASVREEGWRAYAKGGLAAMHALADAACHTGRLCSILDHRWDGIGDPERGVWVA